jgi:hypothetical protein
MHGQEIEKIILDNITRENKQGENNHMTKTIDLSKLMNAHRDIVRTDRMVYECDPKVMDVFCDLKIFLNENMEFQNTEEYKQVANDTQFARDEFINKCMINNKK